jgi:hypothetical protein
VIKRRQGPTGYHPRGSLPAAMPGSAKRLGFANINSKGTRSLHNPADAGIGFRIKSYMSYYTSPRRMAGAGPAHGRRSPPAGAVHLQPAGVHYQR